VLHLCHQQAQKYQSSKNKKEEVEEDEDVGHPLADDEEQDEEAAMVEQLAEEELVKATARHVVQAQQQRILYQDKKKGAIATAALAPSQRVLCYVADYAQNMQIPNFASEQPGATYYYSAMNVYVFGAVDAHHDSLNAFICPEARLFKPFEHIPPNPLELEGNNVRQRNS
jgi:hypothetical protein